MLLSGELYCRTFCILTVFIRLFLCVRCRVMTRKQQLRHYNVEKAEEVVAAKNAQKEELVKAVNHSKNIV